MHDVMNDMYIIDVNHLKYILDYVPPVLTVLLVLFFVCH